ncbi:MobV family relaxase [Weissella minor]|uniref:Mobilization protein n=1 Tax=Weissella minor TaxID=1620 RepID=A0A0R2JLK9_9LACO|nr:MobV family relaxase [Weissella minor]KRN78111.1 hypothetical protein IV67_GL001421 [Weissella minor]
MASTISWHFEKHPKSAVNGLQIHNERKSDKHKNARIDPEKTHLNVSSVIDHEFKNIPYTQRIDQLIQERYTGKRKPRKDAIVDVQHTLQFGGDEVLQLSPDKKQEVITTAINFLVDRLGGYKNVIGLNIHRDETNDHVHLDTIPLTEDGRLSAKDIYNRTFMKETQTQLLTHLQEQYPELDFVRASEADRGFENGRSQADFERLRDEKRKQDEEHQEKEKTLKKTENELKQKMVDALEALEPEFKVAASVYDENKVSDSRENYFEFIDEFGTAPMPVNTRQGWRQVYEWLHIDEIKRALEQAKQYVSDFVVNKAHALIRREDELDNKEKALEVKAQSLDQKEEQLYTNVLAIVGEETEIEIKKRIDGYEKYARAPENTWPNFSRLGIIADNLSEALTLTKENIEKNNELKGVLADTVIDLGYLGPEWRDSLIKNSGLKAVNKKTREHIDKPFEVLLPEAIHKASAQQLNVLMERTRRFNNKDRDISR